MSLGGAALCALAILLIANRLVLKHALGGPFRWLYWIVQALDLAAVGGLVVWGMPGMPRETRVMDVAIALLMLWHVVENHMRRSAVVGTAEFRRLMREEEREAARIAAARQADTPAEDQEPRAP